MRINGRTVKQFFICYFEVIVWVSALVLLGFMSPTSTHSSLCPLDAVGFTFCPGCGLGHSISWLFHGNVEASFRTHPLGIFAVVVLTYRIFTLIKNPIFKLN